MMTNNYNFKRIKYCHLKNSFFRFLCRMSGVKKISLTKKNEKMFFSIAIFFLGNILFVEVKTNVQTFVEHLQTQNYISYFSHHKPFRNYLHLLVDINKLATRSVIYHITYYTYQITYCDILMILCFSQKGKIFSYIS